MRTNETVWSETFRTIVTGEPSAKGAEQVFGPFANVGAAKSAGTRASKGHEYEPRPDVTFRVERAVTVWEGIE